MSAPSGPVVLDTNIGDNDVWIAATAAAASALLITTDKDFEPLADTFLQLSRFELSAVEAADEGPRKG